MATAQKSIRTSISLSPKLATRVRQIARSKRASMNAILVDLIERGLDAQQRERERFLELAQRLADSEDPAEQQVLKQELAKITFGQ